MLQLSEGVQQEDGAAAGSVTCAPGLRFSCTEEDVSSFISCSCFYASRQVL